MGAVQQLRAAFVPMASGAHAHAHVGAAMHDVAAAVVGVGVAVDDDADYCDHDAHYDGCNAAVADGGVVVGSDQHASCDSVLVQNREGVVDV